MTSGAFTGKIQGQQPHLPAQLSVNLKVKTEILPELEILVGASCWGRREKSTRLRQLRGEERQEIRGVRQNSMI